MDEQRRSNLRELAEGLNEPPPRVTPAQIYHAMRLTGGFPIIRTVEVVRTAWMREVDPATSDIVGEGETFAVKWAPSGILTADEIEDLLDEYFLTHVSPEVRTSEMFWGLLSDALEFATFKPFWTYPYQRVFEALVGPAIDPFANAGSRKFSFVEVMIYHEKWKTYETLFLRQPSEFWERWLASTSAGEDSEIVAEFAGATPLRSAMNTVSHMVYYLYKGEHREKVLRSLQPRSFR
jgi:hypothetical protein